MEEVNPTSLLIILSVRGAAHTLVLSVTGSEGSRSICQLRVILLPWASSIPAAAPLNYTYLLSPRALEDLITLSNFLSLKSVLWGKMEK